MNLEALMPNGGARRFEVALVGAGEFGRTFLSQVRRVTRLQSRVVCDRDMARAIGALRTIGITADEIRRCDSSREARKAFESGKYVVVEDSTLLLDLPLDMVVEATGIPEAAAAIAEGALAKGMHVAMVTKEAESVVGPLLSQRAREAGLVYTPVDGDQPSLLIGLVSWCRLLGLEILSVGKASEYDFIYDPASDSISAQGRSRTLPEMRRLWSVDSADLADCVAERARPPACGLLASNSAGSLRNDNRGERHGSVTGCAELACADRPDAGTSGPLCPAGGGRPDQPAGISRHLQLSAAT